MRRPPRDPKLPITNRAAVDSWLLYACVLFVAALVPLVAGPDDPKPDAASASMTMTFAVMGFGTAFNALTNRRDPASGLTPPILKAFAIALVTMAMFVLAAELARAPAGPAHGADDRAGSGWRASGSRCSCRSSSKAASGSGAAARRRRKSSTFGAPSRRGTLRDDRACRRDAEGTRDDGSRRHLPRRRLDGRRGHLRVAREAGTVAGAAVWMSFALAGIVTGLIGYTVVKLGVRYPSSGGLIAYLIAGSATAASSGSRRGSGTYRRS